ncbi:MAG: hypothetical protein KKA42_11260, partial [candidate division Zixibacteria bacterium]|nr:hypothetical protein [candidate division Zixibacteria bacterium]
MILNSSGRLTCRNLFTCGLVLTALMLVGGAAQAQTECAITISNITNADGTTQLMAGKAHIVTLHGTSYCSPSGTYNTTNGFRVYTPDGANFGPVQGGALPAWDDMGWTTKFINHFEWNGSAFVPAAAGTTGPAVGADV